MYSLSVCAPQSITGPEATGDGPKKASTVTVSRASIESIVNWVPKET